MRKFTPFITWYGRDVPPPKIVKLQAGRFSAEFQDGDLRYLRDGEVELIRRIYVAVRDVNWNTIPFQISRLEIDSYDDHFHIEFNAVHSASPLEFQWHATLDGSKDGKITYLMDGSAESNFRYCRIGFCVLHPIEGMSGRPYQAVTPGGTVTGMLPRAVDPQQMVNGYEAPLFPSCSSLRVDLDNGTKLTTEFEGDLFEMEDQRNWTDGSYKTYCTPLALGYPHQASAGQRFYQKISIETKPGEKIAQRNPPNDEVTRLTIGNTSDLRLPDLGFEIAPDAIPLNPFQANLLSQLHPDQLRTEVHFQEPDWMENLQRAKSTAIQLDSSLELVLFMTDQPETTLQVAGKLLQTVPVRRVMAFHELEAPSGTTSPHWMNAAREKLSTALPDTPFFGGTNGNFAELNRQPPDISVMDGVGYPINPQVHAADERSLVEAIEAQKDTLLTAHAFSGTLPIAISAVTLKPPFNQAAREEEAAGDPSELPANVDPRQMSLFAAAWTVGSLRSLASGGAGSATYYQLTGWRGLIENEAGSPLPDKFQSSPNMIYPLYWVFRLLAQFKNAEIIETVSKRPLAACALALKLAERIMVVTSNYLPEDQEVEITHLPAGEWRNIRLNEETFQTAAFDEQAFLKLWQPISASDDRTLRITLKPYETRFIELNH